MKQMSIVAGTMMMVSTLLVAAAEADSPRSDIARPRTGAALAVALIGFWGGVLQAQAAPNNEEDPAAAELAAYRWELQAFRSEFGGSRELPDVPLFLFGMGQRAKLLDKADSLVNVIDGKPVPNLFVYPLTWEKNASAANYPGMTIISEEYRQQRLAAPHTWHAAEIFLYLLEQKAK
jgi:hypothetical protein